MDIVPAFVDGAIVCNVVEPCKNPSGSCEKCFEFPLLFRNWVVEAGLSYLIFDFQDEKKLCFSFLEELISLRKRLKIPVLFSGLLGESKSFIERHNCGNAYPLFDLPSNAIRALRMQQPGLTEQIPAVPIPFDAMLSQFLQFENQANEIAAEVSHLA